MSAFDKAWEVVKGLSDYEMAVAREYSDPRDFMTTARMRDALEGMPYPEVVRIANHPEGDLDFRYLPRDEQAGQIESLADEDVEAIYGQMKRLEDEVPIDPCSGCGLPHGTPGSRYCSEECEGQGPYENR